MDDFKDDELISVKLPRKDYETLRDIIRRQEALNWFGRWFRNVLFVAIGGILALFAFWDAIKAFFNGQS